MAPSTPVKAKGGAAAAAGGNAQKKRVAAKKSGSPLSFKQLNILVSLTTLGFLWKLFTQRVPFWGVPRPTISSNPSCRTYHPEILLNCEDIRPLPNDSPWAVISCDPGRRAWSPAFSQFGSGTPDGELFLWNWRDTPEDVPKLLPFKRGDRKSHAENEFHPLGISIVELKHKTGKNTHRVFIANHPKRRATVEVLDLNVETNSYDYVTTITHSRITSPNGVVALDESHFFITNDVFFARKWGPGVLVEALLGLPLGEAVYFSLAPNPSDDPSVIAVEPYKIQAQSIGKFAVPNGIELDHEDKKLYIASSVKGIYRYGFSYDPAAATSEDPFFPLNFNVEGFYRMPYMADNLALSNVNGNKRLMVAGLVSIEAFFTTMISSSAPKPPSWAIELLPKLSPNSKDKADKQEQSLRAVDPANVALRKEERRWRSVFWDDGSVYGGISTAGAVRLADGKEGLLATSLVEEGVLICEGGVVEGRGWTVVKNEQEKREHEEL